MHSIGIIGAGQIGRAIAAALARADIAATIANSRGPDTLTDVVAEIGLPIRAGTVAEAAESEIVFAAVNWSKLPEALGGLPDFQGRILIDTNNPIEAPLFKPVNLGGRTSSEVVAGLVSGARVVKAFNHYLPHLIAGDPASEGGRRVLFYAGDDADAKGDVAQLIERLGFCGIDLGTLAAGGVLTQFPGGALPGLNFVEFA